MLPESELSRIYNEYSADRNRITAEKEGNLWYERMGKFAEMHGAVIMPNGQQWILDKGTGKWNTIVEMEEGPDCRWATTPELITEFLNQLNSKHETGSKR